MRWLKISKRPNGGDALKDRRSAIFSARICKWLHIRALKIADLLFQHHEINLFSSFDFA